MSNDWIFSGKHILEGLENGVSKYPALEGRFPQVAGISFAFDPRKPPLQRVDKSMVLINDEPLDLKRVGFGLLLQHICMYIVCVLL